MEISRLFTYPIKSLRAVPLSSSHVTRRGFPYDRTFMLLKVQEEGNGELECMVIGKVPELALFTQELKEDQGVVIVTFNPPDGSKGRRIEVPLRPETSELKQSVFTNLQNSPAMAFNMGHKYNKWFSDCFGYDVVLAYFGQSQRQILGSLNPNQLSQSWISFIASGVTNRILGGSEDKNSLTFADVANYLIVTEESIDDVSARLPEGQQADITKFRPNIVVKGSSKPWDEDMWAVMTVNGVEITATANCHRYQCIDVDYKTGEYNRTDESQVMNKLMKDRRVDPGAKHRPVFGRYGYLTSEPRDIKVGDKVEVTRRNTDHTVWDWPNKGTLNGKLEA